MIEFENRMERLESNQARSATPICVTLATSHRSSEAYGAPCIDTVLISSLYRNSKKVMKSSFSSFSNHNSRPFVLPRQHRILPHLLQKEARHANRHKPTVSEPLPIQTTEISEQKMASAGPGSRLENDSVTNHLA